MKIQKSLFINLVSIINPIVFIFSQNTNLIIVLNIIFILLFALFYPILLIPSFILLFPYTYMVSNLYAGILLIIIVSFSFFRNLNSNTRNKLQNLFLILGVILFVLFSYFVGFNPSFETLVLLIFVILYFHYYYLYLIKYGYNSTLKLFFVTANSFILYIVIQSFLDAGLFSLYSRLNFNDNVKILAEYIVIPLFFLTIHFLQKKKNNFLSSKHITYIIYYLALLFILILTISRGTIIAYFISILTFIISEIIFNRRLSTNTYIFISVITILLFIGSSLISQTNLASLFVNNTQGLNGRTDIWLAYLRRFFEFDGVYLLFGIGPGDIRRIAIFESFGRYYSHSLFFDGFISFGILGAFIILIFIFSPFFYALIKRNTLVISMLFLTILLFLTHGAITYRLFYVLMAINYYFSFSNTKYIELDL